MSDTLQEREDQKTPDWHNFVPQDDYNVRLCAICGFGKNDHYRFYPQRDQNATTTDYCDECKGRPHAPWCSEFEPPETEANQLLPDGISSVSAGSEHQPAARGGGDEQWTCFRDGDGYYYIVRHGDIPVVIARTSNDYDAEQITSEHNQHQSLVTERELLITALQDCIQSLSRLPDVEGAYRMTTLKSAGRLLAEIELNALNEQRSTSE